MTHISDHIAAFDRSERASHTLEHRPTSIAESQEKLTYVYLTSVAHSGSTLLACLLGSHPSVSTVGEFGAGVPLGAKCSCGASYKECEFWREWERLASREGIELAVDRMGINLAPSENGGLLDSLFYYCFPTKGLDLLRDILFRAHPTYHRNASQAVDKAVRLASILCRTMGTRTFLDTMKNHYQIRFLSRHPGIRLKVISLVRDGRGVVNSLIKRERLDIKSAVDAWLWGIRNQQRVVGRYTSSSSRLHVRLEDLCSDPASMLGRLIQFLEVEDAGCAVGDASQELHVIGNNMRLSFTGEVSQDVSWRRELTATDLAFFESHAGWLNRRLGYK